MTDPLIQLARKVRDLHRVDLRNRLAVIGPEEITDLLDDVK